MPLLKIAIVPPNAPKATINAKTHIPIPEFPQANTQTLTAHL